MSVPLAVTRREVLRFCSGAMLPGFLPALASARIQAAKSPIYGLIVGATHYPAINEAGRKLMAISHDISLVRGMLESFGATENSLLVLEGENATRQGVRTALVQIAEMAGSDEQATDVVFYFSGRGGVRPDRAPTLAPFDALAENAENDIPLADVQTWAQAITKGNRRAVVFLDACFAGDATKAWQNRIHNPEPKTMARKGLGFSAKMPDWSADSGLILSAAHGAGRAYEWKADTNTDLWYSIWTDLLVNGALGLLLRQKPPTTPPNFSELVALVRKYLDERPGYLDDFFPFTQPDVTTSVFQSPLFGITPERVAQFQSSRKPASLALRKGVQDRELRSRLLRVVITGGDSTQDAANPWLEPAQKTLQERLGADSITIAPAFAGSGDRLVRIFEGDSADHGIVAVTGSEFEADEENKKELTFPFTGKEMLQTVLTGPVASHLEVQAVVKQLFISAWSANPASAEAFFELNTPKDGRNHSERIENVTLKRGSCFQVSVTPHQPGIALLLDGSSYTNGIAQLAFPVQQETLTITRTQWTKSFKIFPEQGDGAYRMLLLFFAPDEAIVQRWATALTPTGTDAVTGGNRSGWRTLTGWNKALYPFLMTVLNSRSGSGKVTSAQSLNYTVRGDLTAA